jgi:hypothetical protein
MNYNSSISNRSMSDDHDRVYNPSIEQQSASGFSFSNSIVIYGLLFLLIFSYLGINIITILAYILDNVSYTFRPVIGEIMSLLGYSTGKIIDHTADITTDVAKFGIDVIDDTAHSVSDLLIKASGKGGSGDNNQHMRLDGAINTGSPSSVKSPLPPGPSSGNDAIQNPISSSKNNWCLIGEYNGNRGCIEIDETDKCLSGQIYSSQKICLNPTISPYSGNVSMPNTANSRIK